MIKKLNFEVIHKCQNNCNSCSSNSCIDREKIVDIDTFKKAIEHLMNKGGIEEITLSGGEPMLHPDILDMVSYCHNLGMKVVLSTSGIKRRTHLRPEDLVGKKEAEIKIARILDDSDYSPLSVGDILRLELSGLDQIVFNLQTTHTEVYDEHIGERELWMDIAMSMMRASYSKKIDVDVHFVPMKTNYKKLPEIVKHLNKIGIKNLSILNFVPQGEEINQEKLLLSPEEMQEFEELLSGAEQEFNGSIKVSIPLTKDSKQKCGEGSSNMTIKYDGSVLPSRVSKEIDSEILRQYGLSIANVFTNLEDVKVYSETSAEQHSCKVHTPISALK